MSLPPQPAAAAGQRRGRTSDEDDFVAAAAAWRGTGWRMERRDNDRRRQFSRLASDVVVVAPETTTDDGDLVHVGDGERRASFGERLRDVTPSPEPSLSLDETMSESCATIGARNGSRPGDGSRRNDSARQSSFGAFDSDPTPDAAAAAGGDGSARGDGGDSDEAGYEATDDADAMGDEELVDRPSSWSKPLAGPSPVSIVAATTPSPGGAPSGGGEESVPAGFDVCREYGYKYEYTEEEDEDDDDDDDSSERRSQEGEGDVRRAAAAAAGAAAPRRDADPSSRRRGSDSDLLFHDVSTTAMAMATSLATAFEDQLTSAFPSLVADAQAPSSDCTTYVLGRRYHPTLDYAPRRDDESSLLWFTYRSDFPEIRPYGITTDAGWGCMLRSAQMLLAQAMRLHHRSRDWVPPKSLVRRREDGFVRYLLSCFADFPSEVESFYSVHNMVAAGISRYETLPGEWYGPGTACHVLRDLVELHSMRLEAEAEAEARARGRESDGSGGKERRRERQREGVASSPTLPRARSVFRVFVAGEGSVYKDAVDEVMTRDGRRKRSGGEDGDNLDGKERNDGRSDAWDAVHDVEKEDERRQGRRPSSPSDPLEGVLEDPLLHPLLASRPSADAPNGGKKPPFSGPPAEWDASLLLLIPLRLGLRAFNAESYALPLAHTFAFPQSVGFLGGSPRHALWFYGGSSDGSRLHGLDPHTVQAAPGRQIPNEEEDDDDDAKDRQRQRRRAAAAAAAAFEGEVDLSDPYLRSVHCPSPSTIGTSRIDPSLALGFYCRDRDDFEALCLSLKGLAEWGKGRGIPELFGVSDGPAPDYEDGMMTGPMAEMMMMTTTSSSSNDVATGTSATRGANDDDFLGEDRADDVGRDKMSDEDEDEYVVL